MSMTRVIIGMDSLALAQPSNAVAARWWTTRFGVLLAAAGDEPLDAVVHADITGTASLHAGGPWEPPQSAPHPQAAALDHPRLPRAVRWATALRAMAAALRDDVTDVTVDLQLDDPEAAVDACRAAALLGWHVVQPQPAIAELVDCWRERRPWAPLRETAAQATRTLIADTARLPAKVRIGRRASDPQAVDAPRLQIGDETLRFADPLADEGAGAHEFELLWSSDGRVTLDLLIDEQWRPLPVIEHSDWRDPRNALAASVYASLAYWSAVLEAMQYQLIEPLAALVEETP